MTENAHKQSAAHAAETQALFDGLQEQPAVARAGDVDEVSADLMITPAKDEERDRIEVMKRGLDEERRKFTEAAVKLGREKAALEVISSPFVNVLIRILIGLNYRLNAYDSWTRSDHGKSSRCLPSFHQRLSHQPTILLPQADSNLPPPTQVNTQSSSANHHASPLANHHVNHHPNQRWWAKPVRGKRG